MRLVPRLLGPLRQAGGWGLPSPAVGRPATAPLSAYQSLTTVAIRTGEGTGTGEVSAAGTALVSVGPEGLNTWYVTYAAISTTTGAADTSTASCVIGPIGAGLAPGGQSYAGGGDSIGLGNQVLRPGDYVTVAWTGGNPGDTATVTVFGSQDIPV
jgi:hypothetical protein